ncbi:ribosome assembly factor SBDS [Candidatus Woesearchaeota archaeon]|nr:ribosome assembly factor SBDS [Candidatus Woesearchaeota archaeon]
MTTVDKAVIARLKMQGQNFEILVDCDKALDFKSGKCGLDEALVTTDNIYSDVKKGTKAPENDMKKIFHTEDLRKIAEEIIRKGEIQLTTEHRTKLREEKRKKILELIRRNAIDSKTGLPHPLQRLELAMEQARVHIDEFKKAEEQVQDVLEKLRPIIPIKFEVWEMAIKIPAKHAAQSYRVLKMYGTLKRDEWQNDGSLVAVIDLPAGMSEEFENELNKLTKGESETKILNKR